MSYLKLMFEQQNTKRSMRIENVYNAFKSNNHIFVWSLREQCLFTYSHSDFVSKFVNCQFCIPKYKPLSCELDRNHLRTQCEETFHSLLELIQHVITLEDIYQRELIWSLKSEIPKNLKRERELGDFTLIENEPVLKLVFPNLTLINHQNVLRKYLRVHGCLCKSFLNFNSNNELKCKVNAGSSRVNMFVHFGCVEKQYKTFIVFKANIDEINENDINFSDCQIKRRLRKTSKIHLNSTLNDELKISTITSNEKSANNSIISGGSIHLNSSYLVNFKDNTRSSINSSSLSLLDKSKPFKQLVNKSNSTEPDKSIVPNRIIQVIKILSNGEQISIFDENDGKGIQMSNETSQNHNELKSNLEFIFNDGIAIEEITSM